MVKNNICILWFHIIEVSTLAQYVKALWFETTNTI